METFLLEKAYVDHNFKKNSRNVTFINRDKVLHGKENDG